VKNIGALLDTDVQRSRFTHKWAYTKHFELRKDRFTAWIEEKPEPRRIRNTVKESNSVFESLKKIAMMAEGGLVTLYESDETLAEFINFHPPGFGLGEFDVFRDVQIKHARAPLARGFKIDAGYSPNVARDQFRAFLDKIQHPRYLKLLRRTGGTHKADLYHLWEAEHNRLDAFVTLDVTFINAVTIPRPIEPPVRICTPSQFVQWVSQVRSVV
jgi:hypothetical protein